MPNPRVPDATKRKRGTYRADRSETETEQRTLNEDELEELALYRDMCATAFANPDAESVQLLKRAEDYLRTNGVADRRFSLLVDLMVRINAK